MHDVDDVYRLFNNFVQKHIDIFVRRGYRRIYSYYIKEN